MSFRETSAWISFLTLLVVLMVNFWNLGRLLDGRVDRHIGFIIQVGLLIAFVVLEVVLRIAAAMRAPKDERERLIEMRASSVAFPVLVVGALASISTMHITTRAWFLAQHLLLAVLVAGLVKFGMQVYYFRRGV